MKFKDFIKFSIIIMLLYTFFNLIGIGCPIKFLTGISCAGCGMTRAWISFLHLDIASAFYYHPLFFLPIIYIFIFLFKDKLSHKIFIGLIYIGIILFTSVYIFRLLNPKCTIVNCNIQNGFIYKFIFYFVGRILL